MNTYRDAGHGITVTSLKFWQKNKMLIDIVISIEADKNQVEEILAYDRDIPYYKEYSLSITGKRGKIQLSGCNCGYNGEGPNGTRQILEELGVPSEFARSLMLKDHFSISFNN